LNSWRAIKEWSEKMRDEHIDTEIDAMVAVVDSAIHEMEVYEKYADMMYDETIRTSTDYADESSWED